VAIVELDLPGGRRRSWKDCPVNVVPAWAHRYLRAFGPYRAHGLLYYPGALAEQPARYVRAMEIIGDEVSRIEDADRERKQRLARTTAGAAWAARH